MDAVIIIMYIETLRDAPCDVDILKSLVNECRASSQLDETYNKITPLCVACHIKCEPAVKLLLEAGANVNLPSISLKRISLHWCMEKHEGKVGSAFAIATILLDHGAEVNHRDVHESTPLHLACEEGDKQCVDLLLRNGALKDAVDENNQTPLIRACGPRSSHEVVELLIAAGCDIDYNRGAALLHLVRRTRKFSVIKLLVSSGADLGAHSYLCYAYAKNNIEAMKYLIMQGADVNATDLGTASTALHHVCAQFPVVGCDAVEMLLQHGADTNKVNDYRKSTPLHIASEAINPYKVSLLLNWGADMHIVNNYKLTPLGVLLTTPFGEIRLSDYTRTARLLMASGAILSEKELYEVQRVERKFLPEPCSASQLPKIVMFLRDIRDQCRQPRRLIDTCRIKVRSCIGGQKDIQVRQLFLPNKLKDFLLFSDVFSSEY